MADKTSSFGKYTPFVVTTIVFIILGVLLLLAAILVFEYGSTTTPLGDTITPWYVWLLFGFGFLCFLISIFAYIFMPTSGSIKTPEEKSKEKLEEKLGSIEFHQEYQPYNIQHVPSSSQMGKVTSETSRVTSGRVMLEEPSMADLDSLRR